MLERQLNRGLLETDDADDRCFWFRRVIEDLEESPIDTRIADYIDILPAQTRIDKATIERMNALTEGRLLTKVRLILIVTRLTVWSIRRCARYFECSRCTG